MADGEALSDEQLARARRDLAGRVRALRDHRGLTQEAAGKRAGFSQGAWSNLEKDEANPGYETLLRIQHALELDSIESLIGQLPSQSALYGPKANG